MYDQKPVICVVGPTASGKTELAQNLAVKLDGEVVSADSMQIYRCMDIGTGKIKKCEQLVPHHCLDICEPGEPFSAALFQTRSRECFHDIWARGKWPVLCGGTGFYIRAAIDAYDFPKGDQVGNAVRDTYSLFLKEHGAQALWALLKAEDPESASIIPPNDTKRVIRAFELLADGTSYARQKEKLAHIEQALPALFIGLKVEPEALTRRIDDRVDAMVRSGLVDEVRSLLAQGFREGITAPQAIGYKEIVAFLDGECSLDDSIAAIKTATRRYAKRQRTWFRKDTRIHWIDATQGNQDALLEQSYAIVQNAVKQH